MFKNIIWDYIGKFGSYLVSFLISIVLTRLLSADEFGIMAMVMVVITLAGIFMDMGFNRAIIQHQEVSELQLSTVFYINAAAAVLLMLLCFFSAGPVAVFYKQPLIKPVLEVASLSFLLNGLNLVPSSLIYKHLKIKTNSIITLVASVVSGIIGIVMAWLGYGVWSLVFQSLISSFIILVFNFIYAHWMPARQFSAASIKPLWHYGSRMFASGLLDRIYSRLDSLIIGKLYSANILGYYYRAQSVESFVKTFSAGGIMGSLFPYIAKHQNNRQHLKDIYVKYLHIISFVSAGFCACLFLLSIDIFDLLFTSRWQYAAELFQLMMLAGIVWPVSSLMVSMISGVGNSKNYLKLEAWKKAVLLPVYVFGFIWGLKGFVTAYVIASYACLFINIIFVQKDIAISTEKQTNIILPYITLAAAAGLITWGAIYWMGHFPHMVKIIAASVLFFSLYLAGAYALKLSGTVIINRVLNKVRSWA